MYCTGALILKVSEALGSRTNDCPVLASVSCGLTDEAR